MISDPNLAEYIAALIVEQASEYELGVRCEIKYVYELPKRLGLDVDRALVDRALRILSDCGIAVISDDPLVGRFVSVPKEAFQQFLDAVSQDREEYHRILRSSSDEVEGLNRAESRHYPHMDVYNKYKILWRYAQFRSPWIDEVIRRLKSGARDAPPGEEVAESSAWTGLSPSFAWTEETVAALLTMLSVAEARLDEVKDNRAKAQARAYVLAAKQLAEAPEPPADLIWEIIQRANNVAGIASLFVSIIALFAATS